MEQNVDLLLSQIELLKNALEFYANPTNYKGDNPLILVDNGSQAKYMLSEFRAEIYNK